jgi:cysteine-rich repeat protein
VGQLRLLKWTAAIVGVVCGASASNALASDDYFGNGDGHHGAKTVSAEEVVNAYSRLATDVAVDDASLEVVDGSKFAAGDLVLVWQVNGYATPTSGDQNDIDLDAIDVGRFELARVDSVVVNVLRLRDVMTQAFPAASSQVVFVPEYTDVSVEAGGEVKAADWDPVAGEGGIVAIFASGTVTVNGSVSANGAGFLGGTDLGSSGSNGCSGLDEPSPSGAEKGESIAGLDLLSGDPPGGTGRGNRANGGGGGICHNSGGGGGGHGALGGLGGRTWRDDADPLLPGAGRDVGGMGGAPLSYGALTRLTMGGGGGAGQQNNNIGGPGGDGGGVVLVRARSLAGGGSFEANGADGGDSTGGYNDAAGGAGAGGLVVLRAVESLACGSAQAIGGEGGTALFDDHGTGGGGAGGHTLLQGALLSCASDVSGGIPGVQTDLTDPPGAHYGALPGEAGDQELPLGFLSVDRDGDGLLDVFEGTGDPDDDGQPAYDDSDDDDDGIPTAVETPDVNGDGNPNDANDQDSDALPDYLDTDSDADGISDNDEAFDFDSDGASDVTPAGNDHDADGLDDAFDADCLDAGNPAGCLVAGAPMTDPAVPDSDGNGTPNWLQSCGDGYLTASPVREPCDDGDGDDANECSNACRFNLGFGPCVNHRDCASGPGVICDSGSALCQLIDGYGPCSDEDENDVCESGICDLGSATCETCGDDEDCASGERCEANTCVPRTCGDGEVDPGEACDDGDSDESNECTSTCLINAGIGGCATEDDCVGSELVCDQPDGVCRYPLGSGSCDESNEVDVCASRVCDTGSSTCEDCAEDSDCASMQQCVDNACVALSCGDGTLDVGEVCDNGPGNGGPPMLCATDCRYNVGVACSDDDECSAGAACSEAGSCWVPSPRILDSDGDGIPDDVEDDGFYISGGRAAGCKVGATGQGGPTQSLLLLLSLCLGIRRYRRN